MVGVKWEYLKGARKVWRNKEKDKGTLGLYALLVSALLWWTYTD